MVDQNVPTPTGPALSASPAHIQRLWDLCRLQRHNLFDDEAISPKEFCALAEDHPAVERLETNDGLRALLAQRDKRVEALEKDRERLDWLEYRTSRTDMTNVESIKPKWVQQSGYFTTWDVQMTFSKCYTAQSLRAAIDAAMKEPA